MNLILEYQGTLSPEKDTAIHPFTQKQKNPFPYDENIPPYFPVVTRQAVIVYHLRPPGSGHAGHGALGVYRPNGEERHKLHRGGELG